ncbi:hypothetical protein B7P43_G17825 [Cryptotermes secundus]|uniref:Uncharacterized protein n=1 Tax=Cryptotermes secundus TaxID=105785 RepID=A0A2J7QR34_9NEOP|nr:hypothetical protein B7P43_G17825 [Cryptotermes secundus]
MSSRQVRTNSHSRSSDSSSSSASESPSSVPALNFTLYGAPAPRCSHRTTSGAAKANPRSRSTKPTSCPPASPSSMYCAEELQLDLSFLTADEDKSTIINKRNEVCYKENEVIVRELSRKYKDITKSSHSRTDSNRETNVNCSNQSPLCEEIDTCDLGNIQHPRQEKQWLDSGSESEDRLSKNCNLLKKSDSNGTESPGTVQNFGDMSSSSQGSEEQTDSATSDTSSYVTLSEHSLDSCSSSCSSKSRDMHESEISRSNSSHSSMRPNSDSAKGFRHSNKIAKHRDFIIPIGDTSKRPSPNDFQQVIRRLHNGNLSHRRKSSGRNKTSTDISPAAIRNLRADTESQVSVSSGRMDSISVSIPENRDRRSDEPGNFLSSSTLENGYDGISTAAESSVYRCREVECDDIDCYAGCNRYIANDEENDRHVNENYNRTSEMCGKYCLNKSHKTATEERRIEEETIIDQSCVCCEGGVKICNYTNGFIPNESNNRPIHDSEFRITSDDCSRNESYFEEHSDEIMRDIKLSVNRVSEETESVPSDLNSPGTSDNYISPTDFEHYGDFDKTSIKSAFEYHQLPAANNREVERNVNSPPTGRHAADRMRLSSPTCNCDAGRKTKPSVKLPESHYFSVDSAPDVPLSASEAMEAILYARRLLCVLENALDRALSSNTDRSNTESSMTELSKSFLARITRRKQRPRSLSPNILRRCNGIDSVSGQAQTKIFSDSDHSALGDNAKQTSGVKPLLSLDGVSMRSCCYRAVSPFFSLTPEQLRKQRALLKPATDRRIRGDVIKILDVADILRNAILQRRTFMDPTDEFVCGTNRSVSECSLENAW